MINIYIHSLLRSFVRSFIHSFHHHSSIHSFISSFLLLSLLLLVRLSLSLHRLLVRNNQENILLRNIKSEICKWMNERMNELLNAILQFVFFHFAIVNWPSWFYLLMPNISFSGSFIITVYKATDYSSSQDQDSLLVKRRNDNHSPGPVIRELVPSSHQRSELSNTILCIFSRWD